MYTEQEKKVLGQYLSWYIAMRSEDVEEHQESLVQKLQTEKEKHQNAKYFAFQFEQENYVYFVDKQKLCLADTLTTEIIELGTLDLDTILSQLSARYDKEEITGKLEEIIQYI